MADKFVESLLKQKGYDSSEVNLLESPLQLEGLLHLKTTVDSGSSYAEGAYIRGVQDYIAAGDDAVMIDVLGASGSSGVHDHAFVVAGYTTGDSGRLEWLRVSNTEFDYKGQEIYHTGNLDINDLSGVPTSRTLTAGSGMTGGGDLSANRTFNVGAGDGISVSADAVAVDSTVVRTGSVDQTISGQKTFSNTVQVGSGDLQSTRVTNLGQLILINNTNDPYVDFRDALAGNSVQLLSDPSAGLLYRKVTAGTYEIWDEGNDGAGSGMDSDLLDGLHASQFIRSDIYNTASGSVNFTDTSGFILGFDAGVYQITVHDGTGNFNIKANVDVNDQYVVSGESAGKLHLYTAGDGFEFSIFGHDGLSTTAGAAVSYDWAWRFNESGLYRSTSPGGGGGVSNALPAIGNDGKMYPDGGTIASGRVPYIHSSGYLTSSSALSFSGSTLTATNLAGAGAGITGVVHTTGDETVAGIKTFSGNNVFTGINTLQSNQPELRWFENDTTNTNWKVITASGQLLFQPMNDVGSATSTRVRLYQDGGLRLGSTDASPGTNSLQVDGTMYGNYLRLTEVGDVTPSSTTHPFQLGSSTSLNLVADANEIMARNNGAVSTLYLNSDGGQVQIGGDIILRNDDTIQPTTNDAGSVGTASKYFATGYFTTLYVDTLDVGTVDIGTFSDESILFANASGDIDEDPGVFVYDDANQQLEVPFIRASATVDETGGTQYPISSFIDHNASNETINAGKHNFYASFSKTGSGTYTSYTATGYWHQGAISAGQIQNLFGFNSRMQVDQGATVVDMIHFQADTAYNSGYVGTVNTRTGFRFRNYNKDVSFTTQYGFRFDHQVYGDSIRAFYSDQNSGSDKYNLYFDGTAKSWSNGQLILGNQGASETAGEELVVSDNSSGAGIRIKSTGDASLTLEADTDNSGEDDNPYIHFLQDGASVQAWIGHFGNANTSPLGSTIDGINGNAFGIVNINGQIMLGAGNKKTYTAVGDGTTEIFATNTRIHAHPDSENETVYLDLASQWSDTRNADTMIRLYGQQTGAWSNLLQIKMQTDSAILNLNNTTGNIAMQLQGTNRILVTPTYVEVNHPLRANSLIVNGSSAIHDEVVTVHGGFAISIGEGLEFAGNNDYFGAASDARIIRALDTNGSAGAVDGGIIFGGYTTGDDTFVEWLRMRNTIGSGNGIFQWMGNTIWHAGNDGASSGLDADTLDGVQGSGYVNTTSAQTVAGQKTFTSSPVIEHTQPAIYFDESDYSSIVWSPRQASGDFYIAQLDGSFAFVKNVFIIKEEASSGLMTLDNGIVDISGVIELNDPVDVNLTSTGNAIQIGAYGSPNLVFDSNEMQARNNGAASSFNINILGGDVTIGASGTTTTLNATAVSIPNGLLSLGGVSDTTTAPTKVAVETGNDNIVRWQAPDVFANNLNVRNRYYKLPNTSASAQWVKIGTFTAPQAGQALKIDMVLHSGYNAANTQDVNIYLFFKTSNSTSTDANGFAGNAWHYVIGNNATDFEPTWVANASGGSATAFDLYMNLPVYTLNSFYNVYFSDDSTSWAHVGGLGQSDPGGGSATVCVSESVFDVKAQAVKINGYIAWHSGNDGVGSGLEADILDGLHASSFVQLIGAQSVAGVKTLTNNLHLESTQPALLFSETDTTDDNFKFILSSSSFYLQEIDNAFGTASTVMRWYHGGGLVIGNSGGDPGDNNVLMAGTLQSQDITIQNAIPSLYLMETDTTDQNWRMVNATGILYLQSVNDSKGGNDTVARFFQGGGMVIGGTHGDPGDDNLHVEGNIYTPNCLFLEDTAGKVIEFDLGGAMITVHDGFGNFNLKAGVDETHTVTDGAGGSHIEMDDGGFIQLSVTTAAESASFTDDYYLKVDGTVGYNISKGNFLPSSDSAYNLGANSVRWATGYFDDVTTSDINASNQVRLTNTNDLSVSSSNHAFQIGASSGQNLAIDNNEIMSRNNGIAATLSLNFEGGNVSLGNSGVVVVGDSLVTVGQTMRLGDNARLQLDDAGTTDQNYSIENSSGIFRIAKVNNAYSGYTPLLYLNEDGGMSLGNGLTSDTPAGDLHAAGEVFANQKFMAVVEKYKSVTTVQNWKIAEIPASSTSTGDYLVIELMGGRYHGTGKASSKICLSGRDTFTTEYYAFGQINTWTGIRVYNNGGVREVYLYLSAEQYCHAAVRCYATGWGSTRIELFPDPVDVGTTPTGTLVFDSTSDTPDAHIPGTGSGSTFDADLLDGQHGAYYLAWANFTGVPSTFTPSSHTHVIGDTTGLQAALDSKLASSSYTAADVLTKIKTVDGSGTGLDADLIDGVQLSDLVQQSLTGLGRTGNQSLDSSTDTAAEWANLPVGYSKMISTTVGTAGGAPADTHGYFTKIANRDTQGGWAGLWVDYSTNDMYFGKAATSSVTASWYKVWHESNDGGGSGLDADTVDGIEASALVQIAGSQTITGTKIFSSNPGIQGTQPTLFLMETDTTDENWKIVAAEGNLSVQLVADNYGFIENHTRFYAGGGMSIGTTAVNHGANSLYVQGGARVDGQIETNHSILIDNDSNIAPCFTAVGTVSNIRMWADATNHGKIIMRNNSDNNRIILDTNGDCYIMDRIGLGTSTPSSSYQVDVAGHMRVGQDLYVQERLICEDDVPQIIFFETDGNDDENFRFAMSSGSLLLQKMDDTLVATSTYAAFYPSGGFFWGTSAADPGANNLIVRGDIKSYQDFSLQSGDGKGLRFWDADSYSISMSSTGNGTWGGDLSGDSDYNMYFRMASGTNRGFVFKDNTTPVYQIDSDGKTYHAATGGLHELRINTDKRGTNMPGSWREFKLDYGTDLNWKKVARIQLGSGNYAGLSIEGEIDDTHANNGRGHSHTVRFSAIMSNDEPGSSNDYGQVCQGYVGYDYVRLVRTAADDYEFQVRQKVNYKSIYIKWRITYNYGSNSTVTYYDDAALVNGTAPGTEYLPEIVSDFDYTHNHLLDSFNDVHARGLRLPSATMNLSSTGHTFQLGETTGNNLRMDSNKIQAVSNGGVQTLLLNSFGGDLQIGENAYIRNTGALRLGSPDLAESMLHVVGQARIDNLTEDTVMSQQGGHFVLEPGTEDRDMWVSILSTWGSTRTYDARLRLYGAEAGNWNNHFEFLTNGGDCYIDANNGDLFVQRASTTVMKLDSSNIIAYRDIIPSSAAARDLGSSSNYFNQVWTEEVRLDSQKKLVFDEDSGLGGFTTNLTFLCGVADTVIGCNSNNNGTGDIWFGHGDIIPGDTSWETLMHLTNDGRLFVGFDNPSLDFEVAGEMRLRNSKTGTKTGIYFGTHSETLGSMSQMIHFSDNNNNADGFSIISTGQADPVFDGVTFSDLETDYLYFVRHNTSTAGAVQMSFARGYDSVGFGNAQPNTNYQISSTGSNAGNVLNNVALRNMAVPVVGQGTSLSFTGRSNTSNSNEDTFAKLWSTVTKLGSADFEGDFNISIGVDDTEHHAVRWNHHGNQILREALGNPVASELTSDGYTNVSDRAAIYVKNEKFVIAYNQGGSVYYLVINLDGSDTTWSVSTTAP